MTIDIKHEIKQTGDAEYTVSIKIDDNEPYSETFCRSNAVWPAYRSMIDTVNKLEDCTVTVTTNSAPLEHEYNGAPNPNATMLQHLKDVAARKNVDLTILLTQ